MTKNHKVFCFKNRLEINSKNCNDGHYESLSNIKKSYMINNKCINFLNKDGYYHYVQYEKNKYVISNFNGNFITSIDNLKALKIYIQENIKESW